MKTLLLLLVLAGLGFGTWFFFSSDSRVLDRLRQEGILLPEATAKVLFSSGKFRAAEHVIECRWADVSLSQPESAVKATPYTRENAMKNPEVRPQMNKIAPYAFGEFSWPDAQLFSGSGPDMLSEFLLVHFSDDRVLIWYNVD